jgi:hypothetical protein
MSARFDLVDKDWALIRFDSPQPEPIFLIAPAILASGSRRRGIGFDQGNAPSNP